MFIAGVVLRARRVTHCQMPPALRLKPREEENDRGTPARIALEHLAFYNSISSAAR
jgi:hypothetical protein